MTTEHEQDPAIAVAGLAREVQAMGELLKQLSVLPNRTAELSEVVEHLVGRVAERDIPQDVDGPISWLDLTGATEPLLSDLISWMRRIYMRYPDAAQHLPDCWLWHPEVVEELLWLRQSWAVAYHPAAGSPQLAGDWHDRYRPGVVRRIREQVGACALERHADQVPTPDVPLAEAVDLIAGWWGSDRAYPAPPPAGEHFVASERRRRVRVGARR